MLCVLIGPDEKMFTQILHELHTTSSRFTASAESFAFYLPVLYVEIGYVRIRAYSLRSAFVTAVGTDAAGTLGFLSLFRKYRYAIFPT